MIIQDPKQTEMASLIVGDLSPGVTEQNLFNLFNSIGPVTSVRLCRDFFTRNSLGYAYVNFLLTEDAIRALKNFNFTQINGKKVRITLITQNDPKSTENNLLVKNLDESIGNRSFFEIFSVFGDIISSRVAKDSLGNSLGYGFVKYKEDYQAAQALEQCNKQKLISKKIEMTVLKPSEHKFREQENFKNVYVKNFSKEMTEEGLRDKFSRFGKISSIFFPLDEQKRPKGFALIDYEQSPSAQEAIAEMHRREPDRFYVAKAMSKSKRRESVMRRYQRKRDELDIKTAGRNVFVKNIPLGKTEEELISIFSSHGEVESASIKRNDDSTSKGHGFVLFKEIKDAVCAIKCLNGTLWCGRELYAALWFRKDSRADRLCSGKKTGERNGERTGERTGETSSRDREEAIRRLLQNSAVAHVYAENQRVLTQPCGKGKTELVCPENLAAVTGLKITQQQV